MKVYSPPLWDPKLEICHQMPFCVTHWTHLFCGESGDLNLIKEFYWYILGPVEGIGSELDGYKKVSESYDCLGMVDEIISDEKFLCSGTWCSGSESDNSSRQFLNDDENSKRRESLLHNGSSTWLHPQSKQVWTPVWYLH